MNHLTFFSVFFNRNVSASQQFHQNVTIVIQVLIMNTQLIQQCFKCILTIPAGIQQPSFLMRPL